MNQLNIFDTNIEEGKLTKIENGEYIYFPSFFNKSESDGFFADLKNNIVWKQESMNMYPISFKRNCSFCSRLMRKKIFKFI